MFYIFHKELHSFGINVTVHLKRTRTLLVSIQAEIRARDETGRLTRQGSKINWLCFSLWFRLSPLQEHRGMIRYQKTDEICDDPRRKYSHSAHIVILTILHAWLVCDILQGVLLENVMLLVESITSAFLLLILAWKWINFHESQLRWVLNHMSASCNLIYWPSDNMAMLQQNKQQ